MPNKFVSRNAGTANCRAKLEPAKVRAIRAIWLQDMTLTHDRIAKMYGVSPQTIHNVLSLKTWKTVRD